MKTALVVLSLLFFPVLAGVHARGEQPLTVYYNAVIARVPLGVEVDVTRPGAIYFLTGYPGYTALIQADYESGSVTFPSFYEPNNSVPSEVKLVIVEAFKALMSKGPGIESRVDAYYLGGSGHFLYACSTANVSSGPGYQAVYSNGVLLRGLVVLGGSSGYGVVVVFDIVESSEGFCGTPINMEPYGVALTAASVVIAVSAILSYVAVKRESAFKLGVPG